jgi:hypothetical protein
VGEPQALSQKIGLTRGKAALVGVLAIALAIVVYIQYGPSGQSDVEAVATETRVPHPPGDMAGRTLPVSQATAEVPETIARLATTAGFDQSKWQPPELAAVVSYDPFALPPAFPQPPRGAGGSQLAADGEQAADRQSPADQLADAVEALRMELAALQERGVHVILRERNQYVAMIGDRTVHVGDEINGFTVTAIEPDGVLVERKIQQ